MMIFKKRHWKLVLASWAVLGLAHGMKAQGPEPATQPKPAGRAVPVISDATQDTNSEQDSAAGWNPDTTPVTGLQAPTIGNPGFRHSYWVPGFQYGGTFQDLPNGGSQSGNWYSNNYLGANFSLLQQWGRFQLTLNSSVGGFVTDQPREKDGWYQQLALSQNFSWRRWQMQFLDQFAYLPETQFGFGAGTGLSSPGILGPLGPSVPGISGSVVPNQSNFASIGPQYSNSFVTQITYQTSRRGSLTVGGADGLLRFTQSGNVDSDTYIGNVGYNYQLTKFDFIGLFYRLAAYHYDGNPQAFADHVLNFVYGRKITRRLAFQITGGPDLTNYRVPLANQKQTVSGSGGVHLTCAFQNGSISVNYFHGVSGGSGILIGSDTDNYNLTAARRLTRVWSVQTNFGYAKNQPLISGVGAQGSAYKSFFAGGGFSRPIGKELNISFAYQAQIQQQNATVCTGAACNTSYTQNSATFNLQWHSRPFVLE